MATTKRRPRVASPATFTTGQTVYVGTHVRYLGRATVEKVEPGGYTTNDGKVLNAYVVKLANDACGRVAEDQMFRTAREGRDNAAFHILWNR